LVLVQFLIFLLDAQLEYLSDADGHGNVFSPESFVPGQHWSPAHMELEPGHGTCESFEISHFV